MLSVLNSTRGVPGRTPRRAQKGRGSGRGISSLATGEASTGGTCGGRGRERWWLLRWGDGIERARGAGWGPNVWVSGSEREFYLVKNTPEEILYCVCIFLWSTFLKRKSDVFDLIVENRIPDKRLVVKPEGNTKIIGSIWGDHLGGGGMSLFGEADSL